jgi:NADH-quinone oxidoreductase subunit D
MVVNLGPSHPATHGTVRLRIELDGETIVKMDPEIGFLHRGFQKSCENVTWTQVLPYTDRLDYVASLHNNFGYLTAVEQLIGLADSRARQVHSRDRRRAAPHRQPPHHRRRAGLELGGFSAFLYAIEARELITDRVTELTGARLTTSYGRIGGLNRDLPAGWEEKVLKHAWSSSKSSLDETDALLTRNRIFTDRMRKGTGVITKDDALDFGFTGPCLRACGVNYDVRKAKPYWVYDRSTSRCRFGHNGDNFDRYYLRVLEIHQSIKMIRQAIQAAARGPGGHRRLAHRAAPQGARVQHHRGRHRALQAGDGGRAGAPGEIYSATESANGELGWYLRSDGAGRPYKCHVRAPGFQMLSGAAAVCVKAACSPT